LLGVAVPEGGASLVGGVLPHDDVGSGDIELAGRLAELIDRLQGALDGLTQPKSVRDWMAQLRSAADALTCTPDADVWQRLQLEAVVDDVRREAAGADRAELTLVEVRALLGDRLKGRPTTANFRTGYLTICTLVPMRSVPHRVVCLLGLDDGMFPRQSNHDGDDIMLKHPHVGDRDGRAEDRQLLLDAVLAARDALVITYCGRDERTNASRPPAVPVGELLDTIDRTVQLPDGPRHRARDHVIVNHTLQPFDPRNFTAGALVPTGSWSFDPVALAGARALPVGRREAANAGPLLARPLPPMPLDVIELEELVRFVQHPVKAFLRERLGIRLGKPDDELDDAIPIDLDPLDKWSLGQRLIEASLAGVPPTAAAAAEIARGNLPPNQLAKAVLHSVLDHVDEVVTAARDIIPAGGETASVDVNLRLPDGRALVGTVAGVTGDVLCVPSYARVGPKHRLATWVRFLALMAAHPGRLFQAATVGRVRSGHKRGASVTVIRLGPFDPAVDPAKRAELAIGHLAALVSLYERGLREPLPIYCKASAAYAEARAAGRDAERAAAAEWDSQWGHDKENKDPEHALALGGELTLADVLAEPPRPDECGEGWAAGESSRFGHYAIRLWGGLLACESVTDL
jgi:exodeoxyribonuclease V gamma subunit